MFILFLHMVTETVCQCCLPQPARTVLAGLLLDFMVSTEMDVLGQHSSCAASQRDSLPVELQPPCFCSIGTLHLRAPGRVKPGGKHPSFLQTRPILSKALHR